MNSCRDNSKLVHNYVCIYVLYVCSCIWYTTYSRTSLIHTPINRLLGLSDLHSDNKKMATLSSDKSNFRKGKCVVRTLEDKVAVLDRLKDGATQEKRADEYLHTVLITLLLCKMY